MSTPKLVITPKIQSVSPRSGKINLDYRLENFTDPAVSSAGIEVYFSSEIQIDVNAITIGDNTGTVPLNGRITGTDTGNADSDSSTGNFVLLTFQNLTTSATNKSFINIPFVTTSTFDGQATVNFIARSSNSSLTVDPIAPVAINNQVTAILEVGPGQTYTTIQAAIDAASNGDVIRVLSGVYNENVTINKSVTLEGPNKGIRPTIPDINLTGGININQGYRTNPEAWIKGTVTVTADNVTIDGFRLRNENGPLQWTSTPDNFKLLNNYVTGYNANKGPRFGDANSNNPTDQVTGWQIDANYIGGLLGGGGTGGSMYLAGLSNSSINNNTFWRPRAAHLYLASLTNVTIDGNKFYHGLHAGGADFDGFGKFFSGTGYGYGGYGGYGGSYGGGYGRNYWLELKGRNDTVNIKNNIGEYNSGGIQLYGEVNDPFVFKKVTIEKNTFPANNFINAYTQASNNNLSGLIPAVMATARVVNGGPSGSDLVIRDNKITMDLAQVKYNKDHKSSLEVRGNFNGVTIENNTLTPTGTNGGVNLITGLNLYGSLPGQVSVKNNEFFGEGGIRQTASYYGIDVNPTFTGYGTYNSNLNIQNNTIRNWEVGVVLRDAAQITANSINIAGNNFINNSRNVFDGIDPTITASQVLSYLENQQQGATLGTVSASDNLSNTDNVGIRQYSISSGNESGFFSINSSSGQITLTSAGISAAANNFESLPNTFTLGITVTDGGGLTATNTVTLRVTNVNEAPGFASATATFPAAENSTTVGIISAAADPDAGDTLTYTLSGVDVDKFNIDNTTRSLTFKTAPDFEAPGSAARTNTYSVTVTATDSGGLTATQTVTVNVTDVVEVGNPPVITSSSTFSVAENTTAVGNITATDADGNTLTYIISGGADQSLFNINRNTGVLSFVTAPNFEAPGDVGSNNVYNVQIGVTDGNNTVTQDLIITVTNVNEAPSFATPTATFPVEENSATVGIIFAATDPDAGNTLTYTLSGADVAKFNIDNTTRSLTFKTAPDFEAPGSVAGTNTYSVTVIATDGGGLTATQAVTVNVTDVDDTPPDPPQIINFRDDVAPVTGTFGNGTTTDDLTPTLNIKAEAGSSVRVFRDGLTYGDATAANTPGDYTFTTANLAPGTTYSFTAQATDAAGNVSPLSNSFTLTVGLPGYQQYNFTYRYGNGDSYSGYVYAPVGTYNQGQNIPVSNRNETGQTGSYTIDSFGEITTDSSFNNLVYLTSYNDADTGFGTTTNIWPPQGTVSGFSGLGSEYGFAYDANFFSSDPYFSNFFEADIRSNNVFFEFTYYYGKDTNNDYYKGYGYASRDYIVAIGDYIKGPDGYAIYSNSNDTVKTGYYKVTSVRDTSDFGLRNINTYIWVNEYFDIQTDQDGIGTGGYGKADYVWAYGGRGLGSEEGYAYNLGFEDGDNQFNQINSADIATTKTFLSIRNPGNAWLQAGFEGNEGTSTNYTFEVVRQGNLNSAVSVNWNTQSFFSPNDPNADANDFVGSTLPSGTVNFAPGQSTAPLTISVQGDNTIEFAESFQAVIDNPDPTSIALFQNYASSLILNDDGWLWGWGFGDPHLVTLDGLAYDFMAVGEFVLVETTDGSENPFQVQVRYEPYPGSEVVSVTTRMAVKLGERRIELQLGPDPLLVDGSIVSIAPTEAGVDINGDGTLDVERNGNVYTITLNDLGEQVRVEIYDAFMDVNVLIVERPAVIKRGFRGLLGNRNNDRADDLTGRDGTPYPQPVSFQNLYGPFADSWRVDRVGTNNGKDSLFSYGVGEEVGSFNRSNFPQGVIDLNQVPTDLLAAAVRAAAGITDPILKDAAIYDYLLTGERSFIAAAEVFPDKPKDDTDPTLARVITSVGVAATPLSITEGNSASQDVTFRVWRTNPSGNLTVDYRLEGSINADDLSPGTPLSGLINFADGETEKLVKVTVLGDTLIETDEQLVMRIETPNIGSVMVAAGQAATTIISDDLPPVTIRVIAGNDTLNAAEKAAGAVITGTATGLAQVQVTIAGQRKTVNVIDGNWTANFTPQELPGDGSYSVEAIGIAQSGSQTIPASRTLLLDTTPPNAPVINPVTGDDIINPAERSSGITITGTAEANSRVRLTFGNVTRTVTAINGQWSVNISAGELPSEGILSLLATATDTAGNTSAPIAREVRFNRAPSFANTTATFSTAENSTTAGIITAATDPDAGDTLIYTLSGADGDKFNIDSSTRLLSFKTPPDFEAKGSAAGANAYSVTVTATDRGGLTATQAVTVNVTDVVEIGNPPVITSGSTFPIAENSTTVATIMATDVESSTLNYSISGGVDQNLFAIDPTTGALRFVTAPNFEAPTDVGADNRYNLQIQVKDSDNNTVTKDLIITVTGVNEAPSFNAPTATLSAGENTILVGTVAATDPDREDTLTYTLSGADAGKFDIDSTTQFLSFKTAPNFEAPGSAGGNNTYNVTVTARDGAGLTTNQAVTINVTNVNEAPRFATPTATFSRAENTTTVEIITATDPDGGDTLTYSLSGADEGKFNIDSSTRLLSFKTPPDFEAPGSAAGTNTYRVTVTAKDAAGLTATQEVTVNVTDVVENGNPPLITSPSTFSIAENSTAVGTIIATDADSNTLTYSISGGADRSLFTINANTGALSFVNAPNFEALGTDNIYNVQIGVTDGVNPVTQDLIITVTNVNEAPSFTNTTATFPVAENSTTVGTIAPATDPDAGDTLTYTLSGADGDKFNIDSSTRLLSFKTAPNFEVPGSAAGTNAYSVTVTATDGGGLTTTQAVTVNVTDVQEVGNPPVITSSSTFSVTENSTAVAIIVATDADGNTLTYSISGGADRSLFTINGTTGALSFVTAPNFEAPGDVGSNNVYNVQIGVTDGNNPVTQDLIINVTNINEAPTDLTLSATTIAENQAIGTVVGNFSTTDPDAGNTFTYSLVTGAGATDNSFFTIDGGQLKTAAAFDFENKNSYSIRVRSTDQGGQFFEKQLTINVTNVNEAPTFPTPTATFNTPENSTNVGTIAPATDPDGGDILNYTLSGADATKFNFNTITRALSFKTPPDFEAPGSNTYSLTITATDVRGLNATQTVTVNVTGINEAPSFANATATFSTAENSTTVGTIAPATDPDAGDTLTYSLSGADADKFNIDNRSLTFKTPPDFEAKGSAARTNTYSVTVTATDSGGLTATQTVTVNVTNVVEVGNPPVITSSSTFSVAENTTAVGNITATDADGNTLTYIISGGADQSLFNINRNTGVLSFVTAPNFEAPGDVGSNNVYNVQIGVTDGNNPVTQDLIINVTNINEAPTDLTLSATTIAENQAIGTVVGNLSTTDPDAGNTFTYSLVTGTGSIDNSSFTIDRGQLKTAAAFDFETKNSYSIRVRSTDQGGQFFEKQLTINVTNENEPPVFSAVSFPVRENSKLVGRISVQNPEPEDVITFALAGVDAKLLSIDSQGNLTFNKAPDFEKPEDAGKNNIYQVQVTVGDGNTPPVTQDIDIKVEDVNEAPAAIGDFLAIVGDTSGSIEPLKNDTDPDSGDKLKIIGVTDGKQGKVEIIGDQLKYTLLDAAYTGDDVFSYTISDQGNLTATANVKVNVTGTKVVVNSGVITDVQPGDPLIPSEAGSLSGIVNNVSFNFRAGYNPTQARDILQRTLVSTDAAFNNLFGLYEIDNATGTVNGIAPGQPGYARAALNRAVSSFAVRAGGSGNGITGNVVVGGDKFYAPFVIANGGNLFGSMQDAINTFFQLNADNSRATAENYTSFPVAYFSFGAANPDGAAHIKSFGNNIFGFEDLPAGVGVNDYDFNDTVFSFG
ncbi:cadherin domain-containing protein [Cylindrospermopsis curvispora]|uniref:Cadherin domain-containing protein n=1 Tax=Cylindrospermopsis curvispora GIHE-G1 TaxID=2666332 RepID=A0A7H0F4M3_9CYAN|nr:cadherin domain-containing protein [Cylindrospermopsis curvispora]QNP30989.1 cadherin domain-containing protein [Cylindrospermopsis curvispora GIHE-G1]